MDNFYRENILDHYKNPRNFGRLKQPDTSYEEENSLCGDRLRIEVKLLKRKKTKIISQIRFSGQGCAISLAAASLLTEKVMGKELTFVAKLTSKDVLALLGIELGPTRLKCALLPLQTIQKALDKLCEPHGLTIVKRKQDSL